MQRYLPFIIVIAIALATLGSGAMLYRAKRPQLLTIPGSKALPGKGAADSAHIRGNPDAPVAEAAGLQGRFWEMHDLLYREQAIWSKADNARELFDSYAGMIGLNIDQFKKDIDGEKAKLRVDSDHERGGSLGVESTPTLFINNHEVGPSDNTPAGLRASIDAVLKEKS